MLFVLLILTRILIKFDTFRIHHYIFSMMFRSLFIKQLNTDTFYRKDNFVVRVWSKPIIPRLIKMAAFNWSMTRACKTHAPGLQLHNVTVVFTLLCMSNYNNLKALCIPYGEGRTTFLREKMKNVPINTKKKNAVSNIERFKLTIDGDVYRVYYIC